MKKRLLSLLLCAVLLLGTAVPALAEEGPLPEEAVPTAETASIGEESPSAETVPEEAALSAEETDRAAELQSDGSITPYAGATYQLLYKDSTEYPGTVSISGTSGNVQGKLVLPDRIDGKPVSEIGNYAFYSCSELTGKLKLPQNVRRIGKEAFALCSGLTGEPSLNQGLNYIGESAFDFCHGLTGRLTIPDSVKIINQSAFYNCEGLESLTIAEGVTNIQKFAFSGCSGITGTLTLPASLVSVASSAFLGCTGVETLQVAAGSASYSAQDLMLLSRDGSVLYLCLPGKKDSCRIPQTVSAIGPDAFRECTGLTGTMYIPAGVTSIGDRSFCDCTGLTDFEVDPDNPMYRDRNGMLLTKDGTVLLSGLAGMTGVCTVPDTVTHIGKYAFKNCEKMTGLILPDGLQIIEPNAFHFCTGLTGSLVIPDTVTEIGHSSFRYCTGFDGTLTLGRGLTELPMDAIRSCGFRQVDIPRSIKRIREYNFLDWENLETVCYEGSEAEWNQIEMNSGNDPLLSARRQYNVSREPAQFLLTYVPEGGTGSLPQPEKYAPGAEIRVTDTVPVRQGCSFLGWYDEAAQTSYQAGDTFTMPQRPVTLTAMWDGLYRPYTDAAYELTYEILPDGSLKVTGYAGLPQGELELPSTIYGRKVTVIGAGAFKDCTRFMGRLWMPHSVKTIEAEAFCRCTGLTDRLDLWNVKTIGSSAFEQCTGLTELDLYNSYELLDRTIGSSAFESCTGLQGRLDLRDAASIGGMAFRGCSGLNKALVIEDNPREIGPGAFADCPGIPAVEKYPYGEEPYLKISNGMLLSHDGKTLLYCPAGCPETKPGKYFIPNGVEAVQDYAFSACTGLKGVINLPGSLEDLGYSAFRDCTGLTGVEVSVINTKFRSRDGLLLTKDGKTLLLCPRGKRGSLEIPEGVETILGGAFEGCTGLTGPVTLPNTVREVGGGAFSGCTGFSGKLTLSTAMTSVGSSVFRDCSGLTGVYLPKAVASVDRWAFDGCTALEQVEYTGTETDRAALRIMANNEPLEQARWTCNAWEEVPCYSITFDPNGGEDAPSVRSEIPGGCELNLPATRPTRGGHHFTGWNDGVRDYAAGAAYVMPMHDVVMKAMWEENHGAYDEFVLGRDNNSFIHYDGDPGCGFYGVKDKRIPRDMYDRLTKHALSSEISHIKNMMRTPWGGSCFGIASTMALVHQGQLELSALSRSGASTYYELPKPYTEKWLLDSINYYQLSQAIVPNYSQAGRCYYGYDDYRDFFTSLFEVLEQEPVVFCFFTSHGGHAILGLDYEKQRDGSYVVKLYDENSVGRDGKGSFWYMYVSADKRSFTYRMDGETLNLNNCRGLSFRRLQDFNFEEPHGSLQSAENELTLTIPAAGSCSLTLSDGTTLDYDGTTGSFSGTAFIRSREILAEDEASCWKLTLPISDAVYVTSSSGDVAVTAGTISDYVSLDGTGIQNAVLQPGQSVVINEQVSGSYDFDAAIATDVMVSERENNLISIAGQATSSTVVDYDPAAQKVTATSESPITAAEALSMVQTDCLLMADQDPLENVVTVSALYEPGGFCTISRMSETDTEVYLYNEEPGTCVVTIYDADGRQIACGMTEVEAHAGAVDVTYSRLRTLYGCTAKVFLLDADNHPVSQAVSSGNT